MSDKEEDVCSSELVKRIMQGDSKAEDEMVEQYQNGLKFVLNQWTSDREQARDVFQEIWRVVIENIRVGKLKNYKKLAGYIVKKSRLIQLIMSLRKIKKHSLMLKIIKCFTFIFVMFTD
ncbi:RNA polymerase sigma factor [Aliikangiella sp. IMCC44359]|uniref:RNA polymerase sigma factor n=1 Tax=Aliikangiella sp. IMCC44359 TaxID=3459125 RepID=UPI00403A8702